MRFDTILSISLPGHKTGGWKLSGDAARDPGRAIAFGAQVFRKRRRGTKDTLRLRPGMWLNLPIWFHRRREPGIYGEVVRRAKELLLLNQQTNT